MGNLIEMIISGLEQLSGGGILLIPLIGCSICAHAIIMERTYHLRRERIIPSQFVTRSIYHELVQGNPEIAIQMCEQRPGPLTNVLRAGIERRDADEETLKRVVRLSINGEKPKLTRYLHVLGLLSAVAIYTGLLGTFLGMIISFGNLYEIGGQVGQLSAIAAGISQALITTAAGLMVALPTYVAYYYFNSKAQLFLTELERHGMSLVRFLVAEEHKLFQEGLEDIQSLTQKETH